jgi:hypothetical protein
VDVVRLTVKLDQRSAPIPAPLFGDLAKARQHWRRDALAAILGYNNQVIRQGINAVEKQSLLKLTSWHIATKCIAMADEVKLPLKTFRFRVKDKTSGKRLDAAAHAVNFVWIIATAHNGTPSNTISVGPVRVNFRRPPEGRAS